MLVHIQSRHPVNPCHRDEIIKIHIGKEEEAKLHSKVKKDWEELEGGGKGYMRSKHMYTCMKLP